MCVDGSSIPLTGYVISVHSDDQFKFTNCVIDKKGVPADLFSINYSIHTSPSSPNAWTAQKNEPARPLQGLMSCQNSTGSLVNPPAHTTSSSLTSFYLYFFDDSSSFACYLLKARFFFVVPLSLSLFTTKGVHSTEWFGKANHGSLCIQVNIPISFIAWTEFSLFEMLKSFFCVNPTIATTSFNLNFQHEFFS